ncbi:MAG: hypothetical protein AABX38_06900 [Candidatus Micrarchaeota archaeon]
MLPKVREVVAIDASKEQIIYNRLTRMATTEFSRAEFLELLKLLLASRFIVNLNQAYDYLRSNSILFLKDCLSSHERDILIDIFNQAGLDVNNEHHRVSDSCNITLEEQDIGTHFFPHLKNEEIYAKTRAKILADRYNIIQTTLPEGLEKLKSRKFDRIFLANVMHFIKEFHNPETGSVLVKQFLTKLRGLLKDKNSFIVGLDLASTNTYYERLVNEGNAEIIAKVNDPEVCRYTVFR